VWLELSAEMFHFSLFKYHPQLQVPFHIKQACSPSQDQEQTALCCGKSGEFLRLL